MKWRSHKLSRLSFQFTVTVVIGSAPLVSRAGDASWGDNNIRIPLTNGMNLISIPVTPDNLSVVDMFAPLGSAFIEAHTFIADPGGGPGQWLSYSPTVPSFLNTLTDVVAGLPLVVHMNAPGELVVEGQPLGAVDVPVESGWNFLGYNGLSPHQPGEVFGEVYIDPPNLLEVFTLPDGSWARWPCCAPMPIDEMKLAQAHWDWIVDATEGYDRKWAFDTARYVVLSTVPDLNVRDISACIGDCSVDPLETDPLSLCALIWNMTATPAFNADLEFFKKSTTDTEFELVDSKTITVLGLQQVSTCISTDEGGLPITFPYQTLLKVEIDGGNVTGQIPERNERNNRRIDLIHIRMPDPAAATDELTVSPGFPLTDSTLTLTADITNLGDADANNVTVRFLLEGPTGKIHWSEDVVSGAISPGATWTPSSSQVDLSTLDPAITQDDYSLVAVIDPGETLKELSETNNTQAHQIFIPDPPTLEVDALGDGYFCCWDSPNGPKDGDDVRVGVTITSLGHPSTSTGEIFVDFMHEVVSGSGGAETWCPDNSAPCCPDPDPPDPAEDCPLDEPWATTVAPITGGQSDWTVNWLQNVAEGTHRVSLELTYCPPDDPNDECASPTTFAPPPFPDLTVRENRADIWPVEIVVDQIYPTINSNPQVMVNLKNQGETNSATFPVKLFEILPGNALPCIRGGPGEACIDEAAIGQSCAFVEELTVTTIANDGGAESVTFTGWDPSMSGDYVIVAVPDPTFAEVYDTPTSNSCQMRTHKLFIRGGGADLTPVGVWAEPANPIVDQKSKLKAVILNANSEGTNASIRTAFYEDTGSGLQWIGTTNDATLINAEDLAVVFIDWTPSREGAHRIVAIADNADDVVESLEDNNELTDTINVRPEPFSVDFTTSNVEVAVLASYTENQYDFSIDNDPAKAWCFAKSLRDCRWRIKTKKKFGITVKYPWFDCDFKDRSSIRIAAYRTFDVKGPDGRSAPADFAIDASWGGIVDDLEPWIPLGGAARVPLGSAYYRVRIVGGIGKGELSAAVDAPIKTRTFLDEDQDSIWQRTVENNIPFISGKLSPDKKAKDFTQAEKDKLAKLNIYKNFKDNLKDIFKDFAFVDATFADEGYAYINNIPLVEGDRYTVFIYLDLVVTAKGMTSYSYADFFYHEPIIDQVAKFMLPDGTRGLRLSSVEISFE